MAQSSRELIPMTAKKDQPLNFQLYLAILAIPYLQPVCTSDTNSISLSLEDLTVQFGGEVECSTGGGGNTASSSSMTGTSAQDSDGDGIPDSSDRCAHNSNHRCFKEGDDTSNIQQQHHNNNINNLLHPLVGLGTRQKVDDSQRDDK